ncbi:unnamed protein product [Adineta ricciae]|uniref:C2 domain-containing protein n=1 Tax=Adineta ricciae TaxID=249248 RepID=A0A814JNU7_ADIRI|nr:unnamed protein product [Adineta ricciae]CAF1605721.1 unnamed protein product [Adineta ricciae]
MTINFCEVCLAVIVCSIITIVFYVASWFTHEEHDDNTSKEPGVSNMQGLDNDEPVARSEPNEIINLDAENRLISPTSQSTGKIVKENSDIDLLQDKNLRAHIAQNEFDDQHIADDYVTIDHAHSLAEYDAVVHPDGKTGRLHLSIRYDDERSKLIVRLLDAQGLIRPEQIYSPETCLTFFLTKSNTDDSETEKHTRVVVENAAISWNEPCTFCSTFEHVIQGNLYVKASNRTDPAAIRDREVTIPLNNLGSQGEEINEWFDLQFVQSTHNSTHETKIFNDPIHGCIELHWLLVKIIDTPQFQRLRRLKQLGVAYYVYPGACHQRFEHSLGTCHLAGELLSRLCERQPELNITSRDVLCVQIAALCHDLGHGPFSHMFEEVIAELRPDLKWKHEQASILMIDHMIKENKLMPFFEQADLNEIDLIFIKELIFGVLDEQTNNQTWPYRGRDISKSFLYEIVSNKVTGIDVDKFDYFARDSYYLGTKISFEHLRFIKFYRAIKVDDGKFHLCLRDKEVKACYEIYRIRDDLHRRAYQHPVVKAIELMLKEVLIIANDHLFFTNAFEKCDIRLAHTVDDMYAFNQIDDHIITLIKHSHHPNMVKAKNIIEKIEKRELYRYIGNTHVQFSTNLNKEACKRACEDIIRHCHFDESDHPLTARDLIIQVVELTCGDRGEDPIRNMWFYTKVCPNKATKISKEQVSTLLPQTFCERDIRLYCKSRDQRICSIVRCGFKEFCLAKKYPIPKGSQQWTILTPGSAHVLTTSISIVEQRPDFKKSVSL